MSIRSASSHKSTISTTAIDPHQLLSLCYNIKETISKLEKNIQLTQLKLKTLTYIDHHSNAVSPRCSDDIIQLNSLSNHLVHQLEELQGKLADFSEDPISFQIASQQLAYFTEEWHNLTPEFHTTLKLANYGDPSRPLNSMSFSELRVRDALLRLKHSMDENERLVRNISNNLESTKVTIQAIFESLQVTKVALDTSEGNVRESIQLWRQSNMWKLTCIIFTTIVLLIVFRLIGII